MCSLAHLEASRLLSRNYFLEDCSRWWGDMNANLMMEQNVANTAWVLTAVLYTRCCLFMAVGCLWVQKRPDRCTTGDRLCYTAPRSSGSWWSADYQSCVSCWWLSACRTPEWFCNKQHSLLKLSWQAKLRFGNHFLFALEGGKRRFSFGAAETNINSKKCFKK